MYNNVISYQKIEAIKCCTYARSKPLSWLCASFWPNKKCKPSTKGFTAPTRKHKQVAHRTFPGTVTRRTFLIWLNVYKIWDTGPSMIIWERSLDFLPLTLTIFFQQGDDLDAAAFQKSLLCRIVKMKPPSKGVLFERPGVLEKPILLGYRGVFLEEGG